MAKHPIRAFLSRIFGRHKKQEQPEEEQRVERAPPDPAPAPPELEAVLQLRPEHAIYKLWELRRQEITEPLAAPSLRMESPKLTLLTPKEARRELMRLQMGINASANQRLSAAIPPQKARWREEDQEKEQEQGKEQEQEDAGPVMDARVIVLTTMGQMTAWLLIYPPVGKGEELSRDMLTAALEGSGVAFGVDDELLDELPKDPNRYFHLFLAAQGERPVQGKNGYIVDHFARKPQQRLEMDEYGQMDYTNLNLIQNVKEGEVICDIIAPTLGEAGFTVLGKELPAKDGRPATPPVGRNTKLSEDGTAVIAAKTGDVKFNGRTFTVRQVLEVEGNVDYSVGSINYVGDVHVHGDVLSGFSIQALGDITVDGAVEACTIIAGGDLVVAKGIAGSDQAIIRVHGSIYTKYLESCCVYVRNSLQTDCIMNCDVYSDSVISVRTGRATIIGSSIRAGEKVDARAIGSQVEAPTQIILGGLPCEEFEREVLVKEIEEFEQEMKKLEIQPEGSVKQARLPKLRMKVLVNKKKLEQVDKDLATLWEELDERRSKGRLVCDIAYRGTEIIIGSATLRLTRELRPCHARLEDGEIGFF